jgi:hypothetical protein
MSSEPIEVQVFQFTRSAEPSAVAVEGSKPTRRYAISSDSYVPQDGFVLPPERGKFRHERIPARYNHGKSQLVPLPVGTAHDPKAVGRELHAHITFEEDEDNRHARAIRKLADAGALRPSVGFSVTRWHAPTAAERKSYGIPDDEARMARVADEWIVREVSLVDVQADDNAGPRGLAGWVERGVISDEERAALEPPIPDPHAAIVAAVVEGVGGMVDKRMTSLEECVRQLSEQVRSLQSTAKTAATSSARVEDTSRMGGAQKATADGRLYGIELLGAEARRVAETVSARPTVGGNDGGHARNGEPR